MSHWSLRIAQRAAALAATVAIAGLATAVMVRNAPGFDSDERLLDARLNDDSRAALASHRAGENGVAKYYLHQIEAAFAGDFGASESLNQPIALLIRSRLPVTAALMAAGIGLGWVLASSLALLCVLSRNRVVMGAVNLVGSIGLAMPAAVIAILIFVIDGPPRAVIGLMLFPRLFETVRNLLADAYASPQVLAARAMGANGTTILLRYVLPARAAELLGLAGLSVVMAFGAAIPVETLCDLPGLGQLAWKAAIARDLPVLIALTTLLALVTQLSFALSELVGQGFCPRMALQATSYNESRPGAATGRERLPLPGAPRAKMPAEATLEAARFERSSA